MKSSDVTSELKKVADPKKGKFLQRFFKTGKGEYAEGDIFIGVTVPESRKIVKRFKNLPLAEVKKLLKSKIHEERLVALLILVSRFKKGDENQKKEIYKLYLGSTRYINNWDLVDLSAGYIVGAYLDGKNKSILTKLAKSKSLWERRIAIISTFYFIYNGDPDPTLEVSEVLLNDKEDLIYKAVGWMLREVGKRISQEEEEKFLKRHYKKMPRTMLRYAIERFRPDLRLKYLKSLV